MTNIQDVDGRSPGRPVLWRGLLLAWWLVVGMGALSAAEPAPPASFAATLAKARQGDAQAQTDLGLMYGLGQGVPKDYQEAVKWFRKAAEQGLARAQGSLGSMYAKGRGVPKDYREAVQWYRKAAEQGLAMAQGYLGVMYRLGRGVPKDYVRAYQWFSLAAAQGDEQAGKVLDSVESLMTPAQIAEAQRLAREFRPRQAPPARTTTLPQALTDSRPTATGSGFFITADGYLITNGHVVHAGAEVRVRTATGLHSARVISRDVSSDLALLKVEGRFSALPVIASRKARLGATVATVGFPDPGLQGFAPKLANGAIAALTGPRDDPRYFQISVPIQPGNSGGPLVNLAGEVVGINTLIVRGSQGSAVAEGLGFAIPSNTVQAISQQLIEQGYVAYPYLGIRWQWITPNIAYRYGLPVESGAYISEWAPNSPAEQAGLASGDIITKIGEQALDEDHPFINILYGYAAGETTTLELVRGQETLNVQVTFGNRPAP